MATDEPEGIHELAMRIRYDLTHAQGLLTELMRQAALLEPAHVTRCHLCGYRPTMNLPSLAEHMQRVHGIASGELCAACGLGGGNHTEDCTTRVPAPRAQEARATMGADPPDDPAADARRERRV